VEATTKCCMPSVVFPRCRVLNVSPLGGFGESQPGGCSSRCLLMVLCRAAVSFFLLRGVDTWQLIINTATTIVRF